MFVVIDISPVNDNELNLILANPLNTFFYHHSFLALA